jgi:hypothetical protein
LVCEDEWEIGGVSKGRKKMKQLLEKLIDKVRTIGTSKISEDPSYQKSLERLFLWIARTHFGS